MKNLPVVSLLLVFLWLFTSILNATQIEYKYSYIPKKIYENQLFPVTIIGIGVSSRSHPSFSFDKTSHIKPMDKKPLVIRNGNDSFFTFYFKAENKNIKLPALNISSKNLNTILPSQNILINTLKKRKDFCAVLAADMKVKNSQVSNYDEKNNMVILNIEAFEANLENMKIYGAIESGVDTLSRKFAKVSAEFYIVVPAKTKKLRFTYFNTIKKQYVFINISTTLKDASIATHSELNPKEDSFEKLKKYAMIMLSLFFAIMFLFKRDLFYLVLATISVITFLSLFIPHKKVCVSQGTPLYILPTQTSTVGTKIDKEMHTSLLGTRGVYSKIEYKDGLIGWIKNENICKN